MKFLIVDGNSIVNRSFYAIKTLTDGHGHNINGVYGFVSTFTKFLKLLDPKYVAIAFDVSRRTFRTNIYKEYKGTRKETPSSLITQIYLLQEVLMLAGFSVVTCPNYEADDIIGTLCSNFANSNLRCFVLTGDKDAYQLVNENVEVILPTTRGNEAITERITQETIKELYGITPNQIVDMKALTGDPSDNVPGCYGIGPKRACELITQFGSLENIYENLAQVEPTIRNRLIADREDVFLSKELIKIDVSAPIELNLAYYEPDQTDKSALISRLMELDMKSIVKKIDLFVPHLVDQNHKLSEPQDLKAFDVDYSFVSNINEIEEKLLGAKEIFLAVDETRNQMGINLKSHVFVMPIDQNIKELFSFLKTVAGNVFVDDAKKLQSLFIQNQITGDIPIFFCTTLAGYILDSTSKRYWQDSLVKKYISPREYVKYDTDNFIFGLVNMPILCYKMLKMLQENNQLLLLQDIEIPFARLLAEMEATGITIDISALKSYGDWLMKQVEETDLEIFKYNDDEIFNINSTNQISDVFFNKLKLPHTIKSNGRIKTDAETLKKIANTHPIVNLVLKHRQLIKLKNTYIDGLLSAVKSDGRVHSLFKQTETKTGRISSQDPNLQNIPIRTELGSRMRKFVIAAPDMVLIDADYSQIELRILAQICQDENLISIFNSGQDVHKITAAEIFDLPIEEVSQEMRRRAKAVNFSIIYGIGSFALAEDIGVKAKDATLYIKNYFKKFPGVEKYMQETVDFAREHGFVQTLFGRRIHTPELFSSNVMLSSFGKRVAYNAPIQGTAADVLKIAMVNLRARLRREKIQAKIVLQVHDEIIVETSPKEADTLCQILREEMAGAAQFRVALEVNVSMGKTWADSH